jgi:hypothetical protein
MQSQIHNAIILWKTNKTELYNSISYIDVTGNNCMHEHDKKQLTKCLQDFTMTVAGKCELQI